MAQSRSCYVCEETIGRWDPRIVVDGLTIHEHCAPQSGKVCQVDNCQWQWTVHAGEHVV